MHGETESAVSAARSVFILCDLHVRPFSFPLIEVQMTLVLRLGSKYAQRLLMHLQSVFFT